MAMPRSDTTIITTTIQTTTFTNRSLRIRECYGLGRCTGETGVDVLSDPASF